MHCAITLLIVLMPDPNHYACRCRTRAVGFPDQDCLASGHTYTLQQSPPCQSWMTPTRARTAPLCWQAMAMACPSPASMRATLGATCRWAFQNAACCDDYHTLKE